MPNLPISHLAWRISLLTCCCLSAIGCTRQPGNTGTIPLSGAQLSEREQVLYQRAIAAKERLATSLRQRLMEAIAAGGPAQAIDVCAVAAPELARQVAGEHDVRIGRTSFRRRNSANAAPTWATAAVDQRLSVPAIHRSEQGLDVLLPIVTQPECLLCHGNSDSVSREVATAIAKRYPRDQATGFGEGDLRGWFWIEVADDDDDDETDHGSDPTPPAAPAAE